MQEIELKYRLQSPDPLRARLEQAGFGFAGRVDETNQMFDTKEAALRGAKQSLRLRSATQLDDNAPDSQRTRHTLTFKGPPHGQSAKMREEIETQVEDADAARMILARLGFTSTLKYHKKRETWTRGPCEVVLDELANLGWFLEIEGESEECVHAVARELQLPEADLECRSYAELTRLLDSAV